MSSGAAGSATILDHDPQAQIFSLLVRQPLAWFLGGVNQKEKDADADEDSNNAFNKKDPSRYLIKKGPRGNLKTFELRNVPPSPIATDSIHLGQGICQETGKCARKGRPSIVDSHSCG